MHKLHHEVALQCPYMYVSFLVMYRTFICVYYRYLQEYAPLGTAGGIYHFRDQILRGNPRAFFVFNSDVCCDFPVKEMAKFHSDVSIISKHALCKKHKIKSPINISTYTVCLHCALNLLHSLYKINVYCDVCIMYTGDTGKRLCDTRD